MTGHNAEFRVWLATPDAAELMDPARLDVADAANWRTMRTARRRLDWASSRALLAHVPAPAQQSRSLAHSHGFASLLTAPPRLEVGIDIEQIVPRDFLGMAEIAFPASETGYLASLDDTTKATRFYELWTLKEAFAKALQLPLTEALAACSWFSTDGQLNPAIPTSNHWRAVVYAPRPQLRLAVAVVADSGDPLQGPIHHSEWPKPTADRWPVVFDVTATPADLHCGTQRVTFSRS